MNRPLVVLATLFIACTAAAQDPSPRDQVLSPLPIRDQFLLSNGLLSLVPEGPRVLEQGTWAFNVAGAESNTFAKSGWISRSLEGRTSRENAQQVLNESRFQIPQPLFFVKGETHRTDLSVSRGLAHGIELRVSVPVMSTGGGWADPIIEAVHHALRIGNADRETLTQNRETVFLRHDGSTYIVQRGQHPALGDLAFSAKYELRQMEDQRTRIAVVSTLELPTGNAGTLDGSGSLDAGVELVAARDYERTHTRVTASLGVVRLGSNAALGLRAQALITDTVAVAHGISEKSAVIAQLTVSESPFRQLAVPEFGHRVHQLSVGVQRQIGSVVGYAALIENVASFENSVDAGLAWGAVAKVLTAF